MNVREKASSQPSQQAESEQAVSSPAVAAWGLVTYRVRFNLWNTFLCYDDMPTTDLAEAERKARKVEGLEGVTLLRIEAVRDKM